MRNQRGIVFFLTTVFALAMLHIASAQAPSGGAAPANVPPQAVRTAVVDMVVLLKAHPKLNADLKDFRTAQQGIVTQLMNVEKQLQDDARVITQTLKPGTSEFNQATEALDKRMAEHNANKNRAQRELMIQDMIIKYNAFKSIREEIQSFSVPRGVAVVIDVRGINPDDDELTNAEAEVGQPVVWNAPGVNMTSSIVQMLNQKFNQFPATAKVDNGKVVFLNTNQNDGPAGNGPTVPQRVSPGVAQPQTSNVPR